MGRHEILWTSNAVFWNYMGVYMDIIYIYVYICMENPMDTTIELVYDMRISWDFRGNWFIYIREKDLLKFP